GFAHLAHQPVAGIGNQRRPRIRDEGDRLAVRQPREQFGPCLGGIVLVIRRQRRTDAEPRGQLAGHAGILAGDHVRSGQCFQGAERDVAQDSDRGGDDVEPGRQLRRGYWAAERGVVAAGRRWRHADTLAGCDSLFHRINFSATKCARIGRTGLVFSGGAMAGMQAQESLLTRGWRRVRLALGFAGVAVALAACAGTNVNQFTTAAPEPQPAPAASTSIGQGQIRVGLILPLSAAGNAGIAAQSMKNAAEMALAEFKQPNIQLLVKDDAGNPQGAQAAAQQALAEGAEIIVGPLFAQSVSAVASVTRTRGIPVMAFSTDASVASRNVYLLSFLPESDVKRIVDYAVSRGKRSFAALLPDNAYGTVVEAALQQEVARRRGRIVALEKYSSDAARRSEAVRRVARAAKGAAAIFIPDGADT